MALTREALVEYFSNQVGLDTSTIDDQTPLFSSSLVDSFSMVELIAFLENEGGFKMGPTEINLDNLDSLQAIMTFVASKSA